MRARPLLALCAALLLASCGGGERANVKHMGVTEFEHVPPVEDDGLSPFPNVPLVPLSDVVCSPDKYEGKEIRVQGIALIEPRNNNLYYDLYPKKIGSCGRNMIGMDYPADFLKMQEAYNRKRMEFIGVFHRNLCDLKKYRHTKVPDPDDPSKFICKSVELRSDAFLTDIRGWRVMP
ncbi:MAG: hypothetical protein GC201_13805 [Alphaproteobacteria bacterium]|nr:hypothetical protein [Alphaproteobacteria bacterium]